MNKLERDRLFWCWSRKDADLSDEDSEWQHAVLDEIMHSRQYENYKPLLDEADSIRTGRNK